MISSASVYRDSQGRTLDEAARDGFPDFPAPVTEDQPTVEPDDATYSTRKVRAERAAFDRFGDRATVLRPCAIHGPYSRHPREWWFVKRLLDGRTRIPLAHQGLSRFQTTSTRSIGRFALAAAEQGLRGVHNVSDRDAPTVREIGETIAARLGRDVQWIALPPEASIGSVGRTPWSILAQMIVRSRAQPDAPTYAESASEAIDWLSTADPIDWNKRFPALAAYPWPLFDYATEDYFLAAE